MFIDLPPRGKKSYANQNPKKKMASKQADRSASMKNMRD
jgi:hypothetical protein